MKYETIKDLIDACGGCLAVAYKLGYHQTYIERIIAGKAKFNEKLAYRMLQFYPNIDSENIKKFID